MALLLWRDEPVNNKFTCRPSSTGAFLNIILLMATTRYMYCLISFIENFSHYSIMMTCANGRIVLTISFFPQCLLVHNCICQETSTVICCRQTWGGLHSHHAARRPPVSVWVSTSGVRIALLVWEQNRYHPLLPSGHHRHPLRFPTTGPQVLHSYRPSYRLYGGQVSGKLWFHLCWGHVVTAWNRDT